MAIGSVSIDLHEKERKYEQKYALDNAEGVRLLLQDCNAIYERQYQGDYDAVDIITDLKTAVKKAGLTERQLEVLNLVYCDDLTQEEAGKRVGITKQTVNRCLSIIDTKIARVYEMWARKGEGYCLSNENKEELTS